MILPIKKTYLLIIILGLISQANALELTSQRRAYFSTKLLGYLQDVQNSLGQNIKFTIEQKTQVNDNLSVLTQLKTSASSLAEDMSGKKNLTQDDLFSIYPGENYIKYKSAKWIAQVGFQEVVWGESYGLNYADIVNPKDLRETLYTDISDARYPLLLLNLKRFISLEQISGSIQLLYSPEPKFNKSLPIELLSKNIFPQSSIFVMPESRPRLFSQNEWGTKLSLTYLGYDLSFFTYKYLDRNPTYLLNSANANEIVLGENHHSIQSYGFSLAKTLDDFVLRSDVVLNQNQFFNYIDQLQLKEFYGSNLNALVSIDTPTYHDFSGALILAQSHLSTIIESAFRDQNEKYAIVKLSKSFFNDKSFDLSYTREFSRSGNSIQAVLNYPINQLTEIKLGGELYSGDPTSNFYRLKDVSNIFISLKNYIQL